MTGSASGSEPDPGLDSRVGQELSFWSHDPAWDASRAGGSPARLHGPAVGLSVHTSPDGAGGLQGSGRGAAQVGPAEVHSPAGIGHGLAPALGTRDDSTRAEHGAGLAGWGESGDSRDCVLGHRNQGRVGSHVGGHVGGQGDMRRLVWELHTYDSQSLRNSTSIDGSGPGSASSSGSDPGPGPATAGDLHGMPRPEAAAEAMQATHPASPTSQLPPPALRPNAEQGAPHYIAQQPGIASPVPASGNVVTLGQQQQLSTPRSATPSSPFAAASSGSFVTPLQLTPRSPTTPNSPFAALASGPGFDPPTLSTSPPACFGDEPRAASPFSAHAGRPENEQPLSKVLLKVHGGAGPQAASPFATQSSGPGCEPPPPASASHTFGAQEARPASPFAAQAGGPGFVSLSTVVPNSRGPGGEKQPASPFASAAGSPGFDAWP